MHVLYNDEANVDPQNSEFFIYAGVLISDVAAQSLSEEIGTIRQKFGYKPGDVLKFNTVERPAQIGPDAHREAKRFVMEAAAKHEVKLLASFILHSVATSPDEAHRNEINRICFHFNFFLAREKDHGLVLIDPFTDSLGQLADHLREKFSVGLRGIPYSSTLPMPQILGCHLAPSGTSHFCSLVHIVIGGLRFAVNKRQGTVTKVLLEQLAPLCIRDTAGRADDLSIFFSPKAIDIPSYLEIDRELHRFLAEGGIEAAQEPTDIRSY